MDDVFIYDEPEELPTLNCPLCKQEMSQTALLDNTKTNVMCLTESCELHYCDMPRAAVEQINSLIEKQRGGV